MGRNVLLLYMSIFNKNPKIRTQTQTNEGAVRYLIEEGETPDCILALCSERDAGRQHPHHAGILPG